MDILDILLQYLPHISFFTLSLIFSGTIYFFCVNLKNIRKQLKQIKIHTWIILVFIFLFGLYIRILTPSIFITFFDEFGYAKYASTISNGEMRGIDKAYGYPFILSLIFLVFGPSINYIYFLNFILSLFSIILMFFVGYLFFKREEIGLYSALLLAFFSVHIYATKTMESNTSFIFLTLLSLFSFTLYFKIKDIKSQFFAVFCLLMNIYFRLESVLLLPIFGLMVLLFDKNLKNFKDFRYWVPWLVLIILLMPHLIQVFNTFFVSFSRETTYNLPDKNIFIFNRLNGNSFIDFIFKREEIYPLYLVNFFIIGSFYLFWNNYKKFLFVLVWISSYILLYFSYYIQEERMLLIVYFMILFIFSVGIYFVSSLIFKVLTKFFAHKTKNMSLLFSIMILILILFSLKPNMDYITKNTFIYGCWESSFPYLEREAIKYLNENIEKCSIVMNEPIVLISKKHTGMGINGLFEYPETVKEYFNKNKCLLYFEDVFCEHGEFWSFEADKENCEKMHKKFKLNIFREVEIFLPKKIEKIEFGPRSYKFVLYNISS